MEGGGPWDRVYPSSTTVEGVEEAEVQAQNGNQAPAAPEPQGAKEIICVPITPSRLLQELVAASDGQGQDGNQAPAVSQPQDAKEVASGPITLPRPIQELPVALRLQEVPAEGLSIARVLPPGAASIGSVTATFLRERSPRAILS